MLNKICAKNYSKNRITLTLEIPLNEGSLIWASHRPLFPHYYGVKRVRI